MGNELVVATVPAALTDALVQGKLRTSHDLVQATSAGGGLTKQATVNIDALQLQLGGTTVVDEGGFKVLIDTGTLTFRPSMDLDLVVTDSSIERFEAVLKGKLAASMSVKVTGGQSIAKSFSKTIWTSPPYYLTQSIGFFPVVEVVRISFVLSGEAHASAIGALDLGGITAKADVSAGAIYENGAWRSVSSHALDFQAHGPAINAVASAGASLRLTARADLMLYDVAGPFVSVGAYAKTELKDSYADGLSWTARAGLSGQFGGNLSVLGRKLATFDQQLFDVGRNFDPIPVETSTGPQPPTPSTDCWLGDGLYCGGNGVTGASDVLYRCLSGQIYIQEYCTYSCEHRGVGENDRCF